MDIIRVHNIFLQMTIITIMSEEKITFGIDIFQIIFFTKSTISKTVRFKGGLLGLKVKISIYKV